MWGAIFIFLKPHKNVWEIKKKGEKIYIFGDGDKNTVTGELCGIPQKLIPRFLHITRLLASGSHHHHHHPKFLVPGRSKTSIFWIFPYTCYWKWQNLQRVLNSSFFFRFFLWVWVLHLRFCDPCTMGEVGSSCWLWRLRAWKPLLRNPRTSATFKSSKTRINIYRKWWSLYIIYNHQTYTCFFPAILRNSHS